MKNDTFPAFKHYAYRPHETSARRLTITRIHIDVLTPKTPGAMIRVSAPMHMRTTLFTDEIFFGALEFLTIRHVITPTGC